MPITAEMTDLGATVNNGLNMFPKQLSDKFRGDLFHVLHRVMQHCSGKGFRIRNAKFLYQDLGNQAGMADIGLPGFSFLVLMGLHGKGKGFPKKFGLSFLIAEIVFHAVTEGCYVKMIHWHYFILVPI